MFLERRVTIMKTVKPLTLAAALPILMMGSFASVSGERFEGARQNEAILYETDNLEQTPKLASDSILNAISILDKIKTI